MLPPAAATAAVTACTMPGRSAPHASLGRVIARVEPLTTTRRLSGPFDYRVEGPVEVGALVRMPFGHQKLRPFIYPPSSLPLFIPFTLAPYWVDYAMWVISTGLLLLVAVFVVVTSTIYSFQLFELPYVLLNINGNGGFGPKNSGQTVMGYLYQYAFENGDLGTAAAVGWLLAIIIIAISLIQIRVSGTLRSES